MAVNLSGRQFDMGPTVSEQAADVRLSMLLHALRVVICPGFGVGYGRSVWEPVRSTGGGDVSIKT